MEEKLRRLKEFLDMETELPFPEFEAYYKSLMEQLRQDYDEMTRADRLRAGYICEIVSGNAETRAHARANKTYAKQFRKIAAKCRFWQEAINHRLHKEGASDEDIEQETKDLLEQA
jgi:hypothetical protein